MKKRLLHFLPVAIIIFFSFAAFAQPVISSFSPVSGPVGTTVVISGSNFNTSPAFNYVYFGGVKVAVSAATGNSLTVTIPPGVTNGPVMVTANGLVASSSTSFNTTFPGGGIITPSSFKDTSLFELRSGAALLADFNMDGKLDIMGTQCPGFVISKNLSTPGTVAFEQDTFSFAPNNDCSAFDQEAADLDGDGKLDLIFTFFVTRKLVVYKNITIAGSGDVSFGSRLEFPLTHLPYGLTTADFDGDGKIDVAVTNYGDDTTTVLRNTTFGGIISFEHGGYFHTGFYPIGICAGDMDGDGKADMAVANQNSDSISIFRNTSIPGNISFARAPVLRAAGKPMGLALCDLDGDGKNDIATGSYNDVGGQTYYASLFRNTSTSGNISFAPKTDIPTTNNYGIGVADLDGDAMPEVMASYMFRNNSTAGTLSFGPAIILNGNRPGIIGDIDGDGKPDIMSGEGHILLNRVDGANLTSFIPAAAYAGDTITLTGNNFSNVTSVSIGGAAAVFTLINSTTIKAVVPVTASGSVIAKGTMGIGSLAGFNYLGQRFAIPAITSFSPASGPAGTIVTITGNNFNAVDTNNIVFFGSVRARVLGGTTTSLTVQAPAGASYQPVSVITNELSCYSKTPFNLTFQGAGLTPTGTFADRKTVLTDQSPYAVTVFDYNRTGTPDLLSANLAGNSYSLVPNYGGAGAMVVTGAMNKATGMQPTDIKHADFDRDGRNDFVVANYGSNTISIYRDSGGRFDLYYRFTWGPKNYATGNSPRAITIADFDLDGKPDIAVDNLASATFSVFRNISSGKGIINFAAKVDFITALQPSGIAAADIDGDGKTDIIVSNNGAASVSVFRNTSTTGTIDAGSFAARIDFAVGNQPNSVAVTDIDNDGKIDIAVANGASSNISLLRNTSSAGAVSFAPKADIASGAGPYSIAAGDLDGDGMIDLITTNVYDNTVSVFRNTSISGQMQVDAKIDYATGNEPRGLFIGDVDADGKNDIVVSEASDNTISMLKNISAVVDTVNLCPGGGALLSSNKAGTVYQWQVNTGSGYTNITDDANYSGSATAGLQLSAIPSSWTGYRFRCLVDGISNKEFSIRFVNIWITFNISDWHWEDPARWSCGVVPDANTDVIIGTGRVIISSNVTVRSLTVLPTTYEFSVSPHHTLTVTH